MNLAKEISFLLYKHNCVILPGFGAFLLREKAAERNEIAKYALPKQKVVTFNKQIVNNDGLVANYISTSRGCTYEQGLEKIDNYTQSLWDVLKTKRNVEVAEIGTFYYTQEDKLVFVPYHSVNFDTASFGLPKLRLKTIDKVTAPIPTPEVVIPKQVVAPVIKKVEKPEVAPAKVELPKVKEVVERVAVAKAKTKERNEQLQQKKLDNKTNTTTKVTRFSGLAFVNTLGVLFLIGMAFAMFNFEKNQADLRYVDQQVASFLDTPSTPSTFTIEKETSYGIYALVNDNDEAVALTEKLLDKYDNAAISIAKDNKPSVFIISFSNQELAKEYKNLLQNKLDQKLVIKKK